MGRARNSSRTAVVVAAALDDKRFDAVFGTRRGGGRPDSPTDILYRHRARNLALVEQQFAVTSEIGELGPTDHYLTGQAWRIKGSSVFCAIIDGAFALIADAKGEAAQRIVDGPDGVDFPQPPAFLIDLAEGTVSYFSYEDNGVVLADLEMSVAELSESALEAALRRVGIISP